MDGLLIEILQDLTRSLNENTVAIHEGQDRAAREREAFSARLERLRKQASAMRVEQQSQGAELAGLANRVMVLEGERREREEWTEIRAWIRERQRPWWERAILWWRRR